DGGGRRYLLDLFLKRATAGVVGSGIGREDGVDLMRSGRQGRSRTPVGQATGDLFHAFKEAIFTEVDVPRGRAAVGRRDGGIEAHRLSVGGRIGRPGELCGGADRRGQPFFEEVKGQPVAWAGRTAVVCGGPLWQVPAEELVGLLPQAEEA